MSLSASFDFTLAAENQGNLKIINCDNKEKEKKTLNATMVKINAISELRYYNQKTVTKKIQEPTKVTSVDSHTS